MSYICARCITNPDLSILVAAEANEYNVCDYCERSQPAVDIDFVAQQCSDVIDIFFENSSQTMAVVHFNMTPAGEDLNTLLERLTGAPGDAIEALEETLHQIWHDSDSDWSMYGDDPWFVPSLGYGGTELHSAWTDMEMSLRNDAHYINPKAVKLLDSIFGDITSNAASAGARVVTDAGPSSQYETLYRARVFQSEEDMQRALQHPERNLGAPPAGVAKSGRMNAPGQPAFYGATSVDTALAEVRPSVGSWVVIARFAIIRPLQLLNLNLLSQLNFHPRARYFDSESKQVFRRYAFLRELSRRMVRPVMPESREHNYLITQVVADYLAMHPTTSLDGIIYPSVQRGANNHNGSGENVVLFHKAATAIASDREPGTAEAELYDYDDDDYDERPYANRPLQPTILYIDADPLTQAFQRYSYNRPAPGLKLIRDSIEIHQILAVDIRTDRTKVQVVCGRQR